jgi:hypothetical protein
MTRASQVTPTAALAGEASAAAAAAAASPVMIFLVMPEERTHPVDRDTRDASCTRRRNSSSCKESCELQELRG